MTNQNTPAVTGQAAALPKTYAQHPLSAAFPPMSAEDFQALTDSIDNIGVQNPITLFDGMVLDGWNRYCAALQLGMDCPSVELGDVDPRDFVMAQNKARRHTTQAQLAMATTSVYAWKAVGSNQHGGAALSAEAQKSNKELAAIGGVGIRSIEQSKAVQTNAAPEVIAAVKRGDLGLPKAAAIAKMPPAEQAAAISKPLPRKPTVVVPPPSVTKPDEWGSAPPDGMNEDDFGPSDEEIAAAFAAEEDDRKLMHKILESDDVVATLHAQVKQLQAELRITNERFNGLMNQNAALTTLLKKRDRHIKKLYQEIDELRKQGGAA